MLTLRGHHLLCTLNYSGSGYTKEFVANMDETIRRMNAGEPVKLVWGVDTICQPMIGHSLCHCYKRSIALRDVLGFVFSSIAAGKLLWPGRTVVFDRATVMRLRSGFRLGVTRAGCMSCEWFGHCSRTATARWPHSKLMPQARPGVKAKGKASGSVKR